MEQATKVVKRQPERRRGNGKRSSDDWNAILSILLKSKSRMWQVIGIALVVLSYIVPPIWDRLWYPSEDKVQELLIKNLKWKNSQLEAELEELRKK